MFSFLKALTGFGSKSGPNQVNGHQLIADAFSEDEDVFNDCDSVVKGLSNGLNPLLNGIDIDDSDDNDCWNEEWNAFEENVNQMGRQLLDSDRKCQSMKGVVTQVVDQNVIVIDDTQRIEYERCTFGTPFVGDLVNVETDDQKEVTLKPLRFKVLTGKITDDEDYYKRFVFGGHAYLRKTEETRHLKVGDVIKVLILETRTNHYNWRAILFNTIHDSELKDTHRTDALTNELMQNKNDIDIIDKISFGDMNLKSKKSIMIWIKNKGTKAQTLLSCDNEEGENQIKFNSFQSTYGKASEPPYVIPPKKDCFVELICETNYCGDHNELMIFRFDGFRIARFITVTVHDLNQSNNRFRNTGNYDQTQYRRRLFGDDTWIVPGERVLNQNKHIFDKLEKYRIPEKLWRALDNNWAIDEVFPEVKEPLNKVNYRMKFHALVYLEECQNQINLRLFDLSDVTLRRDGRFLALTVPGLADGRPSLIISDKIIVFDDKNRTEQKRIGYEGFIHEIRKEEIMIRFNEDFHRDFRGGSFKVMFQMGRMTYRRCHHAIDLSPHMVDQVLFPSQPIIKQAFKKIAIESINWFNKSLNFRQRLAVVGALRGECRPTPYIIFGPPGTGKTVTIVESILQVFDKVPHSRIIACTSANSSADLIASKLLESGRITAKDLIRVTALHRINSIPDNVKSVTQLADEDEKKWLYHRVIVTTTSQAGVVFKYKISASHFTHVFIDEAAQVIEPESLIPISMSVIGHGVVVLAGDHHQLGPVIMSSKAKACRLDRSLMERLMTCCKPYERDERYKKYGFYNPKFVTKLVDNYRSDATIMSVPSQLFYENELNFNNKTDDKLLEAMDCKSALVFTGVKGEDRQDPDCPSWYNPQEIIQTCSYLDLLYEAGVKSEDIGIITPYRKQVTGIRDHIKSMGLQECRVATIEEFQGLEKRVIIASLVRSSAQYLDHDLKYNLGFIHNSKRFNVAISRAMALLICIGDPVLLSRDKCWAQLINYCLENDCYKGCKFSAFTPSLSRKRSKIMENK